MANNMTMRTANDSQLQSNISLHQRRNELTQRRKSNEEVYLLNNTTLRMSAKTELPFAQFSEKAREADVLSGLKQSLISNNKMSEKATP